MAKRLLNKSEFFTLQMDFDMESAPAGILLLLPLSQKISNVKNAEAERNGLNLGFKSEIPMDSKLSYFVSTSF